MARRKKRVDHDNHERWLISYADFITLLFAFFVVMYSISSVNEGKYKIFSDSLSLAFNKKDPTSQEVGLNPQEQFLKNLVDRRTARMGEQQRRIQERMKSLSDGLTSMLTPLIKRGQVSVGQGRRGVAIDINESSLFRTGDAALQPEALAVLRQVSEVLMQEDLPIEVEGHTDDIPINTPQYPSNWELSSARASSVVRMMIENGLPAARMSVVGLASNQPMAPNDTPENRARNRRVTITILSPDIDRTAP